MNDSESNHSISYLAEPNTEPTEPNTEPTEPNTELFIFKLFFYFQNFIKIVIVSKFSYF